MCDLLDALRKWNHRGGSTAHIIILRTPNSGFTKVKPPVSLQPLWPGILTHKYAQTHNGGTRCFSQTGTDTQAGLELRADKYATINKYPSPDRLKAVTARCSFIVRMVACSHRKQLQRQTGGSGSSGSASSPVCTARLVPTQASYSWAQHMRELAKCLLCSVSKICHFLSL